jgi:hypothetical protein
VGLVDGARRGGAAGVELVDVAQLVATALELGATEMLELLSETP